jgi:hypothetical protein
MFATVVDARSTPADDTALTLQLTVTMLQHVSESGRFWGGGARGAARLHVDVALYAKPSGLLSKGTIEAPPDSTCGEKGLLHIMQCDDVTTTEKNVNATAYYVMRFLRGKAGI